jgi:hypothetical protein
MSTLVMSKYELLSLLNLSTRSIAARANAFLNFGAVSNISEDQQAISDANE